MYIYNYKKIIYLIHTCIYVSGWNVVNLDLVQHSVWLKLSHTVTNLKSFGKLLIDAVAF